MRVITTKVYGRLKVGTILAKSLYKVVEYTIFNLAKQVLAAAKNGFVAEGVELNPWLVAYSKLQAFRLGLSSCARFYCQDLWKVRLQPYHNVVVFGVQEMVSVGSGTFCL
jgi:hypothetical protein